ncbi:MAG: Tex family protein [Eubacteriales bacterium]|nr:Tex family protein [Eubacteriales bacterium]
MPDNKLQANKLTIIDIITSELSIKKWQTEAVIRLIDDNNTIPFIARYRKEATGNLNDEILRKFDERLKYLRNLWDRKDSVIESIEEQGKLDKELLEKIQNALTMVELEDIYRPYKQKKRTRAMIAVEKGLVPLSELILSRSENVDIYKEAKAFVDPSKEITDVDTAIKYASDIIAEKVSDDALIRQKVRNRTIKLSTVKSEVKKKIEDESKASVYEMYFDFSEHFQKIQPHQILALNRGEREKILNVKMDVPVDEIIESIVKDVLGRQSKNKVADEIIRSAIHDAYKRLIAPSIETELRNELTEKAEAGAISIFMKNLKQLLLMPPMEGKVVLGWDPAFRTGCKLSVVDPMGNVLDTTVIYPTAPQNKIEEARSVINKLVKKYNVDVISLGNGTASRESEQIIVDIIKSDEMKKINPNLAYVIVNEAGASVYSASSLGSLEFPNYDVGLRSSISIARRLQDPLSELVKIDPRSIGVGQYQHDINQKKLTESLETVVEDCVNSVGVDLNTASEALLCHISGINKTIAANIVSWREENGRFRNRKELLKVPKLGPKAFEQAAGFLRIRGGDEPLDMTGVHPESYKACKEIILRSGLDINDIKNGGIRGIAGLYKDKTENDKICEELSIGSLTFKDILEELEKPMRDPRMDMPKPVLRSDVLNIEDLKPGMVLKATIRNVIDFGAFADIGVHQDGLIHISELSDKFIRHPMEVVKVGDIVDVKVLDVNIQKKRIALTMKGI